MAEQLHEILQMSIGFNPILFRSGLGALWLQEKSREKPQHACGKSQESCGTTRGFQQLGLWALQRIITTVSFEE